MAGFLLLQLNATTDEIITSKNIGVTSFLIISIKCIQDLYIPDIITYTQENRRLKDVL